MNEIPDIDRARSTAIIIRLISELAGSDPTDDHGVTEIMSAVIEICYKSKLEDSPGHNRAHLADAIKLITDKDWLFTVRKIGNSFQLEAKFGTEIKTAKLHTSIQCFSKAGAT
jgi:hypothetical protein